MIKNYIKKHVRQKIWMLHAISLDGYSSSISFSRFEKFINIAYDELITNKSVLTFDDGYESVYKLAFPLLKEKGIHFVCFVVADFIDKDGYLSTKQIQEMINSGLLTIQSHGLTHVVLTTLQDEQIVNEIAMSKNILENKFFVQINSFAYSHGQYNKKMFRFLKQAGYSKAYIAVSGTKNILFKNRYTLPRINICDRTFDHLIKFYYEKE